MPVLAGPSSVISRTLITPVNPTLGHRYIVPTGASGDWSGQDGSFAWYAGEWLFSKPYIGFTTWVHDEDVLVVWNGSSWEASKGQDTSGSTTVLIQRLGSVSGSVTPNLASGTCITLKLTGTTVISLSSLKDVMDKVYIWVSQDATGARSLLWGGSNIKWPGGLIPDQSMSANALDYYEFTWMGSAFILTNFIQDCK